MLQCHHWLHVQPPAHSDDITVVAQRRTVEASGLGLHTRPLHREAMRVLISCRQLLQIFGVAPVVVDGGRCVAPVGDGRRALSFEA